MKQQETKINVTSIESKLRCNIREIIFDIKNQIILYNTLSYYFTHETLMYVFFNRNMNGY